MIADRYIAATLVQTILLVLLVLMALTSLITLVGELGDVGRADYGWSDALQFVLLSMPRNVYESLPLAVLVGSLWGLGGLAKTSELTVLRAAGMSILRILAAPMVVGLLVVALMLALGEWVTPRAESTAQQLRAVALGKDTAIGERGGYWLRDARTYIRIGEVVNAANLRDITVFELSGGQRLAALWRAETAHHEEDRGWTLHGIRETRLESDRTAARLIAERPWNVRLDDDFIETFSTDPRTLSIGRLRENIAFLRENGQASQAQEVALWMKVSTPVSVLVMLLVAMPFVFGSMRSAALGLRVLSGAVIGVVFHILNQTSGQLGQVFQLNPAASAFAAPLLVASIAVVMIRRLR